MTTHEESIAVTPEQFARLPKKVQARLGYLADQVKFLRERIEELKAFNVGQWPDTNVKVSAEGFGASYADRPLPGYSRIDFYMGTGEHRKYRNMITVNQVRSKNGEWLRITASGGGGLLVVPVASNDIEVRIDER